MGTRRRSYRHRSHVKFPKNVSGALASFNSKLPRLRYRRARKGKPEPRGTRIAKYALTPEERLAGLAPEGSTPERMLFGWLVKHRFSFTYQEPVMGGRAPGGAIIDFVIYDKQPPIAIRIQSYWHKGLDVRWMDDIQAAALLELGFQVEDVWEYEINTVNRLDRKMRTILFGAPKFGSVAGITEFNCPYCDAPECQRVEW